MDWVILIGLVVAVMIVSYISNTNKKYKAYRADLEKQKLYTKLKNDGLLTDRSEDWFKSTGCIDEPAKTWSELKQWYNERY